MDSPEREAPVSVRPALSSSHALVARRAQVSVPPPRHPWVIPIAAAYAVLFFAGAFLRHSHFGSSTFELGAYHSMLWNVAYRATPWNSLERVHQWSTHLEIGLALLAPLYRIAVTPAWLWLAESLAVAAAALPIDALARRITGDRAIGLVAAIAMLLSPALVLGQLADFHVLALCTLPVAVMAWAVETDSSRGLALGALGAMLLREQMGLVVAIAAVLWVVRHGKRRAPPAVVLAVLAIAVSAIEIFVVVPAFGSGRSFRYVAQYAHFGGTADVASHNAPTEPLGVVATLLDMRRARYVAELLSGAAPLAFLALRSARRSAWPLALALPQLALQLASSSQRKYELHFPYGMPIVPLIASAAVMALAFVPTDKIRDARRLAVTGWLALTLLHLAGKMPLPVGQGRAIDPSFAGSPRALALARAISMVPPEASISAQDDVVPHVAARSEVHRFPDGRSNDDYILLDVDGPAPNVRSAATIASYVRRLRADPHFELLVDQAGVVLAKRVSR